MAFIVILEQGDGKVKENLKLFHTKEESVEYIQMVDQSIKIINYNAEDTDDEWSLYYEEMSIENE